MIDLQSKSNQQQRSPNRRRRRTGRRFGVVTVEMALIAPIVILLVFSCIEFTRVMMVRQALADSARAGCRNACLVTTQHNSSADLAVRATLQGVVANRNDTNVVRVVIDPAFTTSPMSGTSITTTVEVDCEDVSFLPPFFFAGAKISGASTMIRE